MAVVLLAAGVTSVQVNSSIVLGYGSRVLAPGVTSVQECNQQAHGAEAKLGLRQAWRRHI